MKLLIAALAMTAVAARPAPAPLLPTATLDETTFAEAINKIVATYAFCGLPLTDLDGVAQPFLAFAQNHRSMQYTKLLYEFQEESRITMALVQPTKASLREGGRRPQSHDRTGSRRHRQAAQGGEGVSRSARLRIDFEKKATA